jgi:hypothetical protein
MTKYSRETHDKNYFQSRSNNKLYSGEKACQLCKQGYSENDRSIHVDQYKTCQDIHMTLVQMSSDDDGCATVYSEYVEICCIDNGPKQRLQIHIGTSAAVLTGIFLFFMWRRRVACSSSSSSHRGRREDDGRLPTTTKDLDYKRMQDDQIEMKKSPSRQKKKSGASKKKREPAKKEVKDKKKGRKDKAPPQKKVVEKQATLTLLV